MSSNYFRITIEEYIEHVKERIEYYTFAVRAQKQSIETFNKIIDDEANYNSDDGNFDTLLKVRTSQEQKLEISNIKLSNFEFLKNSIDPRQVALNFSISELRELEFIQ